MHEISLVRNIFNTLKETFPQDMDRLQDIYLTVGELSNVQPILMQNAFEAVLLDEPSYKNTQLHVEVLPIKVFCNDCKMPSDVKHYKFICHQCQKPCRTILQGEELLISKVSFNETAMTINEK